MLSTGVVIPLQAASATNEPVVVAHPGINENISFSKLRSIFVMRLRRWEDGTPIKVFVLADDNPLHMSFTKNVLGIFAHQLRKNWDRRLYSGLGLVPFRVDSEEEMRRLVRQTPGAIGYLTNEVDDVHVLSVK